MELNKNQLLSVTYLLSLITLLITLFLRWSNIPSTIQSGLILNLDIISIILLLLLIVAFFFSRTISVSISLAFSILSLIYFVYVIFVGYGGFYLSNFEFLSGTLMFTYLYPAPYWFVGIVILNIVICGLFFKNKSEFL